MSEGYKITKQYQRWAILWPGNSLTPDYLLGDPEIGMTRLFRTRQEVRDFPEVRRFNKTLRQRRDLRQPPHNWKAKRPVKVIVTVELQESGE